MSKKIIFFIFILLFSIDAHSASYDKKWMLTTDSSGDYWHYNDYSPNPRLEKCEYISSNPLYEYHCWLDEIVQFSFKIPAHLSRKGNVDKVKFLLKGYRSSGNITNPQTIFIWLQNPSRTTKYGAKRIGTDHKQYWTSLIDADDVIQYNTSRIFAGFSAGTYATGSCFYEHIRLTLKASDEYDWPMPSIDVDNAVNSGNFRLSWDIDSDIYINKFILERTDEHGNFLETIYEGDQIYHDITNMPPGIYYYSICAWFNDTSAQCSYPIEIEVKVGDEPTPILRLTGDLTFSNVTVGQSDTRILTIHNDGNSTLNVSEISYPNGFSGDGSGSVSAGGSRNVIVTFRPTEAKNYGGEITVNSNGGTNTRSCSGTGLDEPTQTFMSFPATGQTMCYDAGHNEVSCDTLEPGDPYYGQDAHYQPRIPRSYTKLGHGGTILADDEAHVDDGGEWTMTRDNVTGLIWEVKTNANKEDEYSWSNAQSEFITDLNDNEFGGYDNWRMPSRQELASLVSRADYSPTINTDYFPNTLSSMYWSSTAVNWNTIDAHSVNFYYGTMDSFNKSNSYCVRAVRAGQ